MKKERKKKRFKRIAVLFFLFLIVAACIYVSRLYKKDRGYRQRFKELEQAEKEIEEQEKKTTKKKSREKNNPDWIGWLKIKGTTLNYPVMQREGESEYYLHRDFDGKYSFYGTPFLDIRCTTESDNCIIYGHNINGGRMFGALHAYSDYDFYKKHPKVWFRAGEEKKAYHIVSVIKTTTSSRLYSFTDVGNWKEYEGYVRNALEGSLYHTVMGEQIREDIRKDTVENFFRKYQFLTLSTCRTWAGKDARFLVISARERETE